MVREIALLRPFAAYPVVAGDQYAGMIGLDQVRRVAREEWVRTPVRQVMTVAALLPPVTPDDDVLGVLERMLREDQSLIAVVVEGRVTGVLSRIDILELYRVRSTLGAA
jgi:CBS domain-containing protein